MKNKGNDSNTRDDCSRSHALTGSVHLDDKNPRRTLLLGYLVELVGDNHPAISYHDTANRIEKLVSQNAKE